jgi:hypothetical protein
MGVAGIRTHPDYMGDADGGVSDEIRDMTWTRTNPNGTVERLW